MESGGGLLFSRSALRLGEEVLQLPAGLNVTWEQCLYITWLMTPWMFLRV